MIEDHLRQERIKQLFDEVRQCGDDEQAALLRAESDSAIHAEVEKLLRSLRAADDFLSQPIQLDFVPTPSPTLTGVISEQAGDYIGQFRLVQVLGDGGFGVVFLAEQEVPVRRQVALKIVKPGMDSRQVIARFDAEPQALAMMEHPGIARFIDAGVTKLGRPYFVMEWVPGKPVTQFCDEAKLTIPQRLRLFMKICHAVQHAHQKGVIHRDLKPSNVLVLERDDGPQPKVIDFGIAKAMYTKLTEQTLVTEQGQFIGTPAYMSPEQAAQDEAEIDTRSDIYSLGVILYELLTGVTPLDLTTGRRPGFLELERIIREQQPLRPSTRIASLAGFGDMAARRRVEAEQLRSLVRGDLDWIVMKAIEKSPNRRYASADALAADLGRLMNGMPIVARPPSSMYLMTKFIRRHRLGVSIACATLVSLVTAVVVIWFALLEVRRERSAAEQQAYRLALAGAISFIETGESGAAAAQLAEAPPSLRGWEWRHVRARLDGATVAFRAHEDRLTGISFMPDGSRFVLFTRDGTVQIRSADDGTLLSRLSVGPEGDYSGCVDPTADRLLVNESRSELGGSRAVAMFALSDGRELWRVGNALGGTSSFSPDGRTVAVRLPDDDAVAWLDAPTGEELARQPVEHRPVCVALTNENSILYLTASSEKTGVAGEVFMDGRRAVREAGSYYHRPVLNPARKAAAWDVWTDWYVIAHDFVANERLDRVPFRIGHDRFPLAWSRDGRVLAIAERNRILLWDHQTRTEIDWLSGHDHAIVCAAFAPAGDTIVSADERGFVRTWNLPVAKQPWLIERWDATTQNDAAFSPDGRVGATVGWSFVRLWDLPAGTARTILNQGSHEIAHVAFDPSGERLAIASYNAIRVLAVPTGEILATVELRGGQPLAWTPDGASLLSLDSRGHIEVLDAKTGRSTSRVESPGMPIRQMSVASNRLAAIGWQKTPHEKPTDTRATRVFLWHLPDRRLLNAFEGPQLHPSIIQLSPDARYVVFGTQAGQLELWDIARGSRVWQQANGNGRVDRLAFSSDGTRLAVGLLNEVQLRDMATGELQVALRLEVGTVVGLAFGAGDATLIVSGRHHPLAVLDAEPPLSATVRARSRDRIARMIAEPLFRSHTTSDRVLDLLRADLELPDWQRALASRFVQARGDHLSGLMNEAIFCVRGGNYAGALLRFQTTQRQSSESRARSLDAPIAMLHYLLQNCAEAEDAMGRFERWHERDRDLTAAEEALLALLALEAGESVEAIRAWGSAIELLDAGAELTDELDRAIVEIAHRQLIGR